MIRRPVRLLVAAAMLTASACVPASNGPPPTASAAGAARSITGSLNGATYVIQVPARWNGVLLLYSHGGGTLIQNPAAENAFDPTTAEYLLLHGYALAGSSFRSSGWFVEDAIADDLALLDEFRLVVGRPRHTVAWGVSLGSMVTLALAEQHADRIDGALPMCGVVADAVPFWNQNLDAAFAFQALFAEGDPEIAITGSNPSSTAGDHARALLQAALSSAAGRARTALVAALREIPVSGFFGAGELRASPPSLPPGRSIDDLRATQLADLVSSALGDYFLNHPAMQIRAGGNPSSNSGVEYGRVLAASPDYSELKRLYAAAGLSLADDVARLDRGPRITADANAVAYLSRFSTFTGDLRIPVVTLHTLADESTPVQLEEAYRMKVSSAGRTGLLRQLFVDRGAHCNFTTAEVAVALDALVSRIESGRWGAADDLAALNSQASSFDARYRVPGRVKVVGLPSSNSAPSFVPYASVGLLREAAGE